MTTTIPPTEQAPADRAAAVREAVQAICDHRDSGRTTDPRIACDAINRALDLGATYEDINRALYPR